MARSSDARALYPVLVHRPARLLHASFRPRLAAIALALYANPSPPSGWVEDFHLQATEHAQHTTAALRAVEILLPWRAAIDYSPIGQRHCGVRTFRAVAALPDKDASLLSSGRPLNPVLTSGSGPVWVAWVGVTCLLPPQLRSVL